MPRVTVAEELVAPVTITEGEGSGRLRFTALVSRADFLNRNRRVYPADELRRAFGVMNSAIGESYGAVDHPPQGQAGVGDIGIKWLRFFESGAEWYGEGEIVSTAKGRDLQAVIEAGLPIGFSTRGYADQEEFKAEDGRRARRMKNVELVTVDAVTSPSVRDARILGYTKEDEDVEELEQLKAELEAEKVARTAAEERATAAEAELATAREGHANLLAETEGKLTAAEAKVTDLEGKLAEVAEQAAETALTVKLNELTEGHRFAATLISEAREFGVTLETAEKVIARLKPLVEAAGSKANDDGGEPRGKLESDEDKEPAEKPRWSKDQLDEQLASGLITRRKYERLVAELA